MTWAKVGLMVPLAVLGWTLSLRGQSIDGTTHLLWPEEDLSVRLMDSAHQFVERKIADAAAHRSRYWPDVRDSGESTVYNHPENRRELKRILGIVDVRNRPRLEVYGDDANPCVVSEEKTFQVLQARWDVLDGVCGEGLLARPTELPRAHVVVIPDAGVDPESMFGLGSQSPGWQQIARQLAEDGCEVLVPQILSNVPWNETNEPDEALRTAGYDDREWIYRQAFHMGRHVVGYEVQRVMAAIDWFSEHRRTEAPIVVVGYGEGGHLAFLTAAVDHRIDVAFVSGYFAPREAVWAEPIYRNVWSRLVRFGDAEVARLILPRRLIVEHGLFPQVTTRKGDVRTPTIEEVRREFDRIPASSNDHPPELVECDTDDRPAFGEAAVSRLRQACGLVRADKLVITRQLQDNRQAPDAERRRRQKRARDELERHVQELVRRSDHVRESAFLFKVMPELGERRWSTERELPTHDADKFIKGAEEFRQQFSEEIIGRFDESYVPLRPRTRKVTETDKWIAYDVVLDVYDGLFAWGVLVIPKDLAQGERRPVVVCQHGRQGLPRDTLDGHQSAYNDFAAKLAERGFITFAPHNLYRSEDRYRWLDRKANTIGCTLFSIIRAQHERILEWLQQQAFVDGERIAFYGLSYGGETAVRIPALLPGYALSICSGDFNQWTRKVAATDQPFSFMRTIEWEMPYWNLGQTFDYAEMSYLMVPRPLMVERGHLDLVAKDQWVAHEFAKVRWLYAQLGLADRVEIEYFQGGHSIRGVGTFDFLHRHLNWPMQTPPN